MVDYIFKNILCAQYFNIYFIHILIIPEIWFKKIKILVFFDIFSGYIKVFKLNKVLTQVFFAKVTHPEKYHFKIDFFKTSNIIC